MLFPFNIKFYVESANYGNKSRNFRNVRGQNLSVDSLASIDGPKNITIMLVVSCRCQLVCFANCNVHFQASENTLRKYLTDGSSRTAAGIFERIFIAQQGKPNFFIRQLHNCPLCNLDTNV